MLVLGKPSSFNGGDFHPWGSVPVLVLNELSKGFVLQLIIGLRFDLARLWMLDPLSEHVRVLRKDRRAISYRICCPAACRSIGSRPPILQQVPNPIKPDPRQTDQTDHPA